MAAALVGALALASLPSALAFRDTSPLFLWSTSDLNIPMADAHILPSSQATGQVLNTLSGCPSRTYLVVRQEGVSTASYLNELSAPRLGHYLDGHHADVKSSMAISDVVGSLDADRVTDYLQTQCGATLTKVDRTTHMSPHAGDAPQVVELTLSAPPPTGTVDFLQRYDSVIEILISDVAESRDYTVIYTTTAPTNWDAAPTLRDQRTYEMEDPFGDAVHMELKRDTLSNKKRRVASKNKGGLFERYQYLSPGLFMGIVAVIPFFAILLVGLKALSGLEVSYFAFSKEMGPAAQRK